MRLPIGLPSPLVRSPERTSSAPPFPSRFGSVDNFICTTTEMQNSGQCFGPAWLRAHAYRRPRVFLLDSGYKGGAECWSSFAERTTYFDSLVTFLVLVTAQTCVIYANHPMPQEEWFRGKL